MNTRRSAVAVLMLSNVWMAISTAWYSANVNNVSLLVAVLCVAGRSAFAAGVVFNRGGMKLSRESGCRGAAFHSAWFVMAAANICYLLAFIYVKPGRAMFLATLYPMITLLFEWRTKPPGRRHALLSGLLLIVSMFGLGLILIDDFRLDVGVGDVLAISSAFFFAAYMLLAKQLDERARDPAAGLGFAGDVFFGLAFAVILLQTGAAEQPGRQMSMSFIACLSVVVFGLLSGAEFLVINRAFKTLTASEVSMLHLAQPVFVAAIEIVLSDSSRPSVYIGGVLVLGAAALKAYFLEERQ